MSFVDELHRSDVSQKEQSRQYIALNNLINELIVAIKTACTDMNCNTGKISGALLYLFNNSTDYDRWTLEKMDIKNIPSEICSLHSDPHIINVNAYYVHDKFHAKFGRSLLYQDRIYDQNEFLRLLNQKIKELGFTDFDVQLIEVKNTIYKPGKNFFGRDIQVKDREVSGYVIYVDISW